MSIVERPSPSREHAGPATLAVDQLSFLDLLYAVPVADLAMRISGADLHLVPLSDWSALAVILAVIVLSWIGLHKNRAAMARTIERDPIGGIRFLSLRLVQFLIEVGIVGLYFTMGLELSFPTQQKPHVVAAPEEWITGTIVLVFAAYFVWDLIDIWQAHKDVHDGPHKDGTWCSQATAGSRVTLVFLIIFAAFYAIVRSAHPRTDWTVAAVNVGLLVLLWVYRVAQDMRGNTRALDGTDSPGRGPAGATLGASHL